MQNLEEVRRILRSDSRRVLVEAPAGCGKTYEAVDLACDLAKDLKDHQHVLLLTRTNAAKNEFNRRSAVQTGANRVRISTIDSFLLEVCTPYTSALNLPCPLRNAVATGQTSFSDVAKAVFQLLKRAPIVAAVLAERFPVLLLDEHQDASVEQHEIVCAIVSGSDSRVRFFGDSMQAIYDFSSPPISLEDLKKGVDVVCELSTPWRWRAHPELGRWITDARGRLQSGLPLDRATAPAAVTIHFVSSVGDPGYSTHYDGALMGLVRGFAAHERATILARRNNQADALNLQTAGLYTLNEGSDFEPARQFLKDVEAIGSDPKQLAVSVVNLVSKYSVGFDAAKRKQVLATLEDNGINIGRKVQISKVARALEGIYAAPSAISACLAVGNIISDTPDWLKRLTKPRNLALVAELGKISNDELPSSALESAISHEREIQKAQRRSISTIHKAKGLEYPNVMIWNFSAPDFPATPEAARLAYVAISRATEELEIVAPGEAISPLLS
jgi:hypothetical protein